MSRHRSRAQGYRARKDKKKGIISRATTASTGAGAAQEYSKKINKSTVVWVAFLLSGVAGLMHQVVWAKLLVQLIGATAHAQAIVLAVFMAGLAIGAVTIGRRIDRLGRPVRTYVYLEFGIAAYCIALPLLVQMVSSGYVFLASQLFESTGAKLALRLALSAIVVLIPAVLMGGTLPTLSRYLISSVAETRRQVARLYALNSFGAAIGAAVAGFVALPIFGVYGALVVASLVNVMAGGLLCGAARREAAMATALFSDTMNTVASQDTLAEAYRPHQYTIALVALALSGFAAMAYEVLFTRVIALAFGATTHSFSVMLISFITGIAIGSAVAARVIVRNPLWLFGLAQLGVVVAFLAMTPLVSRLPYLIGVLRVALQEPAMGYELFQFSKAAICLGILLLPTICLGFGFPLVAQIEVRSPNRVAGTVGVTYAWNTVGNVLGRLVRA